jgi:thiosulfate dehydrogenase
MSPALSGNPLVSGEPSKMILVVLRGGPAVLPPDQLHYQNAMPGFASYDDAKLADLISYVRRQFGGGASPVTAQQIAQARK